MAPPAVVIRIIGPAVLIVKFEKAPVGAVCGDIGSLFIARLVLIDPLPVQPFVKGAAVVENAVQNDFHSTFVGLLHEMGQKLVAGFQIFRIRHTLNVFGRMGIIIIPGGQALPAVVNDLPKMRVYGIIVLNIILMVGGRYKDGVKINYLHAQILQVVHLVQNALEIASVKFPDSHKFRIFVPVPYPGGTVPDVIIFPVFHIVGRISIVKTIRINLIHDSALCPVRRPKSRGDGKAVVFLQVSRYTSLIIEATDLSCTDLKIITEDLLRHFHLHCIIIKTAFRFLIIHQQLPGPADQENTVHVIQTSPEPDRHGLPWHGLHRLHIIGRLIAE